MTRGFRVAFLVLTWAYLAGIVVQVFLAGIGLFGAARDFSDHVNLGWILHLGPVLLLIAAAVGRAGARTLWWTAALFVSVAVQPFLPALGNDAPWAAALHPVNAMVIFWLTLSVGMQAWRLVRGQAAGTASPTTPLMS